MKKQHLIIISLLVFSLTACGNDKPVEPTGTGAVVETIQPTEASTELNDPVDSTETLVIQGVAIGADGKQMTPEEAAAYEESIRTDSLIETSSETLSEQELSEASERDFTPEEYEQIQDGIEEWNNIEADMIKVE